VSSWNLARVRERSRWSGPSLVAVMNGRLTVVSCSDDSSSCLLRGFLQALDGHLVAERSTPCAFLNSLRASP